MESTVLLYHSPNLRLYQHLNDGSPFAATVLFKHLPVNHRCLQVIKLTSLYTQSLLHTISPSSFIAYGHNVSIVSLHNNSPFKVHCLWKIMVQHYA